MNRQRLPANSETHAHWRRYGDEYRLRRRKLTGWWLCIGVLSLACVTAGHGEFAAVWCLLGTLVSFAFLDEYT